MKSTDHPKPDQMKVASTPERFSSKDLAAVLGKTRQAIEWRAKTEKWSFEPQTTRGGTRKLFPLKALPADIRGQILVHYGHIPPTMADFVPDDFDQERASRCLCEWDQALDWQKERAEARLKVLIALREFKNSRGSSAAVMKEFAQLYARKEVPGLGLEIYDQVPKAGRSRLYEWERLYRTEGIAGLLPGHGSNRGHTAITLDQQRFILGVAAQHPAWGSWRITNALKAKFGDQAASRSTVARFLKRRKEMDPAVYAFLNSPDEYKGRFQPALGNSAEKAQRFLHYVELDSTPADVICSDGKRYTILGACDVFSRKCRFLVGKTSNSWMIMGLLRDIITEWGIPEHVIKDHGKDYQSRTVMSALKALEVECPWIPPFTPESKPHIERVFRTLAHSLQEKLERYIGHNVAERRAIEARRSFADRLMKRGQRVEVGLSPEKLQGIIDRWTEDVYHHRKHSSLGMSPNGKAASVPYSPRRLSDERALDILLAPCGERKVGKKGVRYEKGLYWSDDLIDWIGRKIQVRVDVRDASRVFCFHVEGPFICEARDLSLSGLTSGDYMRVKRTAAKRVKQRAEALKELAESQGDLLAEELNAARSRAKIRNLPLGEEIQSNPFVDAAREAAVASQESDEEDSTRETILSASRTIHQELQIFPFRSGETETGDGNRKVLMLPHRERQQQDQPQTYFGNPRERFEYLRSKRRMGDLSSEEESWLFESIDEWFDYADMFCDQWPEDDRRWLARIAPDLFAEPLMGEWK